MLGKWVIGIVALISIYLVLSVVLMFGFADTEMERYSGAVALVIGIVALIAIVNRDGHDYDDIERIDKEIEKRKKQIEQHEKAIRYYERRKEELENT